MKRALTPSERPVAADANAAIVGVDFTGAPSPAKPITVAGGRISRGRLAVSAFESLGTLDAFDALLRRAGPWIGGFDFPFGLPRELVVALHWPTHWPDLIRHYAALGRTDIAAAFAAFRAARPAGNKYAHRVGDTASGAHSAMKLVNPPVARMLHAGAPRLLMAGVHLPAVYAGDPTRVALEAYPGLVMRSIARTAGEARTPSYKSDAPGKQTLARREARAWLLEGLATGRHALELPVRLPRGLARAAVDDGSGDTIDAIAAAVQAAWAATRAERDFGIPVDADPLEGWIVGA